MWEPFANQAVPSGPAVIPVKSEPGNENSRKDTLLVETVREATGVGVGEPATGVEPQPASRRTLTSNPSKTRGLSVLREAAIVFIKASFTARKCLL